MLITQGSAVGGQNLLEKIPMVVGWRLAESFLHHVEDTELYGFANFQNAVCVSVWVNALPTNRFPGDIESHRGGLL